MALWVPVDKMSFKCHGLRKSRRSTDHIDRVKLRHISMVAIRSPFCRSRPSYWRFIALFEEIGEKTAGIDMIWRNYVTVTLCIHTCWYWRRRYGNGDV